MPLNTGDKQFSLTLGHFRSTSLIAVKFHDIISF